MDFRYLMSFSATPQQVFALFEDKEFLEKRASQGAKEHSASTEPTDIGGAVVTISRTLPAKVPSFAAKFVGEALRLSHVETWTPAAADGGRLATFDGKVEGTPGTVHGTIKLSPTADGSELLIRGTVTVPIPLVGSKLAKLAGEKLVKGFGYEEKFTQEWLAGQASA